MDGAQAHRRGETLRRRLTEPWATALLYAALAVILSAVGLTGLWRDLSLLAERPSPWWTLATALPAAATVLLKRRAPRVGLALAVLVCVADVLVLGGLVPLLVVLEQLHAVTVVRSVRERRTVLYWIAGTLAAIVLSIIALFGNLVLAVMIGLQLGALLGMTFWYANSVAQSRELVTLYRQRAEDLARLAELDRAVAVRHERERMASELHDIVAGHVSAVAIRSEAALTQSGACTDDLSPAALFSAERTALRAVRDSSLHAHEALRSMVTVLRAGTAPEAAPLGRAQLPDLVCEARRSGLRVELDDTWSGALPAAVDHGIARVVQEGLANSAKHNAGAEVLVRIAEHSGRVQVSVVSRGGHPLPHPELRGSGIGLQLLEERVRTLGGTFTAGAEVDGWSISALLPEKGTT
ncbi:sensor histidine kinase [Leucobacter luti]|uniref:sensor histidine kinase n=1 Tax=Leucobacter luti TaxID=340320 RepID=UPI001C693C69|nr:histidine kinase [Leucobacter luti]QYM76744.1 sensor histidine kinase [Leucobacter luti]